MKKIKELNGYQKSILLFLIVISFIFTILYSIATTKTGFEYKNTILTPSQENGNTIYSGEIQGKQAIFIVSEDKTVEFQYGDKVYGPYTVKEDPTAIPQDNHWKEPQGIELRDGDKILFRGIISDYKDQRSLFNEDGSVETSTLIEKAKNERETFNEERFDENGNKIDPMEPSIYNILDLMNNPKLTQKGDWFMWFLAICNSILAAISILYADEIFRWNLSFMIRNVENAEPSSWEMIDRYFFWTILPIITTIFFIHGLK